MTLSPDLDEKLRQLLATIAEEQGFVNYDLQVTDVSTGGANYSSTLHKAKIQEKGKDDLNLFIKVAALGEKTRETLEFNAYDAEQYVYKTLKKIFTDLETKFEVPEEDRLVMPKYYGAISTPKEEMLVLEDLSVKGFTTYDRFKSIDWPYASAAVSELAKFHALGIACAKEYPKEYHRISVELKSEWIDENMFNNFWKPNIDKGLKVVKKENREKLKKVLENVTLDYVLNIYEPVKKPALIHTDFRPSNLMHKSTGVLVTLQHRIYNSVKVDGTAEVIPVDYQTLRIGCMITDLLNLIFTGSDEQFRRQYFDQLVEHYYSHLKAAMTRLGLTDEDYSRDDFDYEFKKKLPEGLVVAAFSLPIITVSAEDAPKLETGLELSQLATGLKPGTLYPDRMNGVVDDYIRWGLI